MAKYIDRDSLIEWLKRIRLIDLSDGLGICRVIMEDDFKKAIKNMPENIIVDVALVRNGRWIPTKAPFMNECEDCSVCGYRTVWGHRYNYCPNCGADMRCEEVGNAKMESGGE